MLEKIPEHILSIFKIFQDNGYEIYLVGGCVRDMLLNRLTHDWDFTTNATPDEILKLFPDGFYDNSFGTVGLPSEALAKAGISVPPSEQTKVIEITTYRTEQDYTDRRHPGIVKWGKTVEEDLERRDFTINAIAMGIKKHTTFFVDPFNGHIDIEKKVIRAVGDSAKRFKEDALRLMRAIRLATQLGFIIEEKTLAEIIHDAPLIKEIAFERIRLELMKILGSEYAYDGIMLLHNTGLLQYILPELLEGIGVSQVRPGRHHTTDVFTHNVLSLKFCPSPDPLVRFATLIHDVGKPRVATNDRQGYVIFHNHELVGARMAGEIAERLRFSKKEKQKIMTLIRWHMFTVDEDITDSAVRRFIRRVGTENVKDIIDLRIGDRLGSGTQTAESWRLRKFKERIEEQLAPAPFSINDLAIDGNDIMKELDIKPSKKVGEILQKLFEEVDEDLSKNTKEYLLQRIHSLTE